MIERYYLFDTITDLDEYEGGGTWFRRQKLVKG